MAEYSLIDRIKSTDLNMVHCGTEICEAGHSFGPAVRDHFLIHYIHSGIGKFSVGNSEYTLGKGQGFLICPNIVTYYHADLEDPWHYSWVGFHGLKAESILKSAGLTLDNPVFSTKGDYIDNCFVQISAVSSLRHGSELRLLGLLCILLSELIEQSSSESLSDLTISRKEIYIKKAIEYIEMNYSRKVRIRELARHLGLDRSYLGSIFKGQLNTTLQEFLLNFRMDKACELMKNETLSIGDISRSVGYDDPLLFSKLFKKNKGLSPREYRKVHI
jgi:AraC-like DNA-binding protein